MTFTSCLNIQEVCLTVFKRNKAKSNLFHPKALVYFPSIQIFTTQKGLQVIMFRINRSLGTCVEPKIDIEIQKKIEVVKGKGKENEKLCIF